MQNFPWILLLLCYPYLVQGSFAPKTKEEADKSKDNNTAFDLEIDEESHIICEENSTVTDHRIWGPYYIYSNDVKQTEIIRLYGEEICQKGYCKKPDELEVLRTYDSFLDYERKLLMVSNKDGKIFYLQFIDDGSRRPFQVNSDYSFFFMKEQPAIEYNPARDYFRGFSYDKHMTGKDAVAFTDFIRYTLTNGNNTYSDMFNNSCEQPFTPYEEIAEVYASVENHYNFYMVHLHCENNQENLYSLIVGADKYCQWNGENETLWFVGLLDLQSEDRNGTETANEKWWIPPNQNNYLWRPGQAKDVAALQHGVFRKGNGALISHPPLNMFLYLAPLTLLMTQWIQIESRMNH